jgi:phenylalanyl-tRNA synthetase beta chain
MRVPLGWLREFVDVDVTETELAHRLDMSGTKVEAIHRPGANIEGIVVAEVITIEPHPNADNLSMVEVSAGGSDVHRVVCGAKNFAVGDRVPLAMVGAKLPGLTITERTIRGEVSRGMLCSAAELGVAKDHSGILVLQPGAELGADVVAELGLGDPILELEITPNRPDCMGLIGIAREVSALLGKELKRPAADLPSGGRANPIKVEVNDLKGCPRYLAAHLEGVTVAPSPAWMAARLLAAGLRPVSNVVDVTNYVLLETGHPLHAFDASKVTDGSIVVRRAGPGETLTTLDGVERVLQPEDLIIADPARALAIAGVMGGLDSEVTPDTTSVVLEAAVFDRASVSFTGRRHSLRSEASARFERGTDIEALDYAAARAALLIRELAGGDLSGDVAEAGGPARERTRIELRPPRTKVLLGLDIPAARQAEHLRSIGLGVVTLGQEHLTIEIPGFRPDLRREADLIEEVARLEGFDAIPSTLPTGPSGGLDAIQRADRTLRRSVAAQGLSEAWTSSFMAPADLDSLGLPNDHPARRLVALSNPMLEQEPALRTTLLPGLLGSLRRNVASHRALSVALFEVARVYSPGEELASEELGLAAVFSGYRNPPSWMGPETGWDFFQVKGVLEAALASLGITGLGYRPFDGAPFHPSRAAHALLGDNLLGLFGELHPEVCDRLDLPGGSLALEIGLAPVFAALPGRAKAEALPRFPSAYIDIAVVVDQLLPAGQVRDLIKRAGAPEVVAVSLFDVYRGEQVPAGKKSLAYGLELSDPQGTLTDERVGTVRDRIVGALAERMGAELRA